MIEKVSVSEGLVSASLAVAVKTLVAPSLTVTAAWEVMLGLWLPRLETADSASVVGFTCSVRTIWLSNTLWRLRPPAMAVAPAPTFARMVGEAAAPSEVSMGISATARASGLAAYSAIVKL